MESGAQVCLENGEHFYRFTNWLMLFLTEHVIFLSESRVKTSEYVCLMLECINKYLSFIGHISKSPFRISTFCSFEDIVNFYFIVLKWPINNNTVCEVNAFYFENE